MKKGLSFLLAVMMLTCLTGPALAYDGVITFQGIPWGSSFEEVLEMLKEKELIAPDDPDQEYAELYGGCDFIIAPDSTLEVYHYSPSAYPPYCATFVQMDGYIAYNKTIAGHPVFQVQYIFARDGEKTALICVHIEFGDASVQGVKQDILDKLTALYGESSGKTGYGEKTDIWYGAEDSCILVSGDFMGYYFDMYYGLLNGLDILQEFSENAAAAQANDMSGL